MSAHGESMYKAYWEHYPHQADAGIRGLGNSLQQAFEQAALALMRIPILYPQHRLLAAQSLLDSGRSLEKLDRSKQAVRLYHELIRTYPQSRSTAEARSRLEEMIADG